LNPSLSNRDRDRDTDTDMQILILLLGCHIQRLLNGRVETAIEFATNTNTTIDWFLSGGVKEPGKINEAEYMMNLIEPHRKDRDWNFIVDSVATNTAENLIMANHTLHFESYTDMYMVTSEFHYNRANAMVDKIFEGKRFNWLLSPLEESDSRYWEKIHIKNVDSDVTKSSSKMRIM
jgi:hypothetical protein